MLGPYVAALLAMTMLELLSGVARMAIQFWPITAMFLAALMLDRARARIW